MLIRARLKFNKIKSNAEYVTQIKIVRFPKEFN